MIAVVEGMRATGSIYQEGFHELARDVALCLLMALEPDFGTTAWSKLYSLSARSGELLAMLRPAAPDVHLCTPFKPFPPLTPEQSLQLTQSSQLRQLLQYVQDTQSVPIFSVLLVQAESHEYFREKHVHTLHEVQFLQPLQLLQNSLPSWSFSGARMISVMTHRV